MRKRTRPRSLHRPTGRSSAAGGPSFRSTIHPQTHARRSARQVERPVIRDAERSAREGPTRAQHRPAGAAFISVLLGTTIAMAIAGLAARFDNLFAGTGPSQGAVLCGVLTALAIGVRVPQRFAMWLCALAWQRFLSRGSTWEISALAVSPGSVDRPLHWVVLSVIALLSGITTALMPLNVRLASSAYDWMHVHFLWSAAPLAVLDALTVFVTALVPMVFLGLAWSCAHHLSCRYGQWDPKATAWLLIGAAAGTWVAASIMEFASKTDLVLVAAGLPTLLVALLSAWSTGSHTGDSDRDTGTQSSALPIWIDRWPTLLRASIVAVAVSGACAAWVWNRYLTNSAAQAETMTMLMLFSLGGGVLAGCRAKRSGLRSIGGFGVACAAAGVVVAVGPVGLGHAPRSEMTGAQVLACANLAVIAFAVAYGHQTLLHRVASRSSVGATILGRMLVACGLTVWVGAPICARLLGEMATLAVLGLSLLALGGMLITHEPSYSSRTRRVRLCAVFGSIGAMIGLALFPPESWAQRRSTTAPSPTSPTPGKRPGQTMRPSPTHTADNKAITDVGDLAVLK